MIPRTPFTDKTRLEVLTLINDTPQIIQRLMPSNSRVAIRLDYDKDGYLIGRRVLWDTKKMTSTYTTVQQMDGDQEMERFPNQKLETPIVTTKKFRKKTYNF